MKIKNLLISLSLVGASVTASADPGSFIVGAVLGSIITQHNQPVYVQPVPVYIQQQPQVMYQQAPVVITESQAPMYDPLLHGFCAGYRSDVMYAQCIGNAKRNQLENAYRRGLNGYR
jgi:hypothetical protein